MNYLEKSCEELDATVFSSDMMFDPERYAVFKKYLGRWNRAVEDHEITEGLDTSKQPAPVQEPVAWADALFDAIKHGDEDHQNWLQEKLKSWVIVNPPPTPPAAQPATEESSAVQPAAQPAVALTDDTSRLDAIAAAHGIKENT
jgi:hypothetical protein